MVFFGSFAAGRFLSTTGLQAQALLVGYVFAFHWALIDLAWYGTEFICRRGSYSGQRWQALDASWKQLFLG
jgi:hypothetical protein